MATIHDGGDTSMEELVIVKKSDLVNIADSIRNLNGTSETMSITEMNENVANVSETLDSIITDQDSLIAQIQTALENKASGGGSSS